MELEKEGPDTVGPVKTALCTKVAYYCVKLGLTFILYHSGWLACVQFVALISLMGNWQRSEQ